MMCYNKGTKREEIKTMTEFEFNSITEGNYLMSLANRQHRIAVEEARVRPIQREAAREYRSLRRSKRLDAALLAASMVGVAVATWFLTSIGAV